MDLLKIDEDKYINTSKIKWIKSDRNCHRICMRSNGCTNESVHKVCKDSKYFERLRQFIADNKL